jgi:hypothetical protein
MGEILLERDFSQIMRYDGYWLYSDMYRDG